MLAVSLHAVRDELRNELVPLNRKYRIAQLLDACRDYPRVSNARRITFEYVMLRSMIRLPTPRRWSSCSRASRRDQPHPVQSVARTRYECSDGRESRNFPTTSSCRHASPVRTPRGRDILAACGQSKSATEKPSARERLALRAMAMTD